MTRDYCQWQQRCSCNGLLIRGATSGVPNGLADRNTTGVQPGLYMQANGGPTPARSHGGSGGTSPAAGYSLWGNRLGGNEPAGRPMDQRVTSGGYGSPLDLPRTDNSNASELSTGMILYRPCDSIKPSHASHRDTKRQTQHCSGCHIGITLQPWYHPPSCTKFCRARTPKVSAYNTCGAAAQATRARAGTATAATTPPQSRSLPTATDRPTATTLLRRSGATRPRPRLTALTAGSQSTRRSLHRHRLTATTISRTPRRHFTVVALSLNRHALHAHYNLHGGPPFKPFNVVSRVSPLTSLGVQEPSF